MKKFYIVFVSIVSLLFINLVPLVTEASTTLHGSGTSDIVSAINQERTSRGLSALRVDPTLSQVAQARSAYLASQGQIFHLSSPDGTPWPELWQAGYKYLHSGENLALGVESAHELASRWMTSPSHRENILGLDYEDVGVGVTQGTYQGHRVSYVVSYFGKKRPGTESVVAQSTEASSYKSSSLAHSAVSQVRAETTSGDPLPIVLPASDTTANIASSEAERVSLLKRLISLLDSYLLLMRTNVASR